jgi:hypothetical protein
MKQGILGALQAWQRVVNEQTDGEEYQEACGILADPAEARKIFLKWSDGCFADFDVSSSLT